MSRSRTSVLLATTNRGKLSELRALFKDLPLELFSLSEVLPNMPQVVEDGATFAENALIKARAAARLARIATIAEDSGIEVDSLGGRPGVRSARFAKEGATDAENNDMLLRALAHVPDRDRRARFRCVMAFIDPSSERDPIVVEGRCEGSIARTARGEGGFGYDPLFIVQGYERTMAELDASEKNQVSHRAAAVRAMHAALKALLEKP